MTAMGALVLVLVVVAIVLLVGAAFGVTHGRVQLVPLAPAPALPAWLWPLSTTDGAPHLSALCL